jgi:transcriptional regulator with XRE-family HTH domain
MAWERGQEDLLAERLRRSADQQPAPAARGSAAGTPHTPPNALGRLLEQRFTEPDSPCHSYSELERRSGVSREAISRYVSGRRERHRSPTIPTLVALARGVELPLKQLCRAAMQSGPATHDRQQVAARRAEEVAPLLEYLTEAQFWAWSAFLRSLLKHT